MSLINIDNSGEVVFIEQHACFCSLDQNFELFYSNLKLMLKLVEHFTQGIVNLNIIIKHRFSQVYCHT